MGRLRPARPQMGPKNAGKMPALMWCDRVVKLKQTVWLLFPSLVVALSGRAAQDISAGLAALEEGRAALKARNMEAAAAAFGKACALAPSEADSCYYSAQTLHILGRFDESQRGTSIVDDEALHESFRPGTRWPSL